MNIKEQMIHMKSLSNTEQMLASYIINHEQEVIRMNHGELSKAANVSVACIYRLCEKLGCRGYAQFRTQLASELQLMNSQYHPINFDYPFMEQDPAVQVTRNLSEVYKQTIDETVRLLDYHELDIFVKTLMRAKNIYLLTTGTNLQVASAFARRMEEIGIHIPVAGELLQQRLFCTSAKEDDAAMIISYAAASDHVLECVKTLHRNKVPILLLSSSMEQNLHYYATARLYLCGFEDSYRKITTFSSFLSGLFLTDMIFSRIYQKNYKQNTRHRDKAYRIHELEEKR